MRHRLLHAEIAQVPLQALLQEVGWPLVVADLLLQGQVPVAAYQHPAVRPLAPVLKPPVRRAGPFDHLPFNRRRGQHLGPDRPDRQVGQYLRCVGVGGEDHGPRQAFGSLGVDVDPIGRHVDSRDFNPEPDRASMRIRQHLNGLGRMVFAVAGRQQPVADERDFKAILPEQRLRVRQLFPLLGRGSDPPAPAASVLSPPGQRLGQQPVGLDREGVDVGRPRPAVALHRLGVVGGDPGHQEARVAAAGSVGQPRGPVDKDGLAAEPVHEGHAGDSSPDNDHVG